MKMYFFIGVIFKIINVRLIATVGSKEGSNSNVLRIVLYVTYNV